MEWFLQGSPQLVTLIEGRGKSKGDKTTQSPRRRSARSCPGEEVSAAVEGERVRCV